MNKPIRETGFVLGKYINEARDAGQSADGSISWNARPEEYVINVYSVDEEYFDKVNGFKMPKYSTLLEYKVDKVTYDKIKFGDWVKVRYISSEYKGEQRYTDKVLSLFENK